MKKFEKTVAKIINTAIDIEAFGWPPICIGGIYQPVRPQERRKQSFAPGRRRK